MISFTQFKTSLFKVVPGPVFGLLSVLIGALGILIAYLLYPPHLFLVGYFESELGMGPGGLFFNFGLIISGILFYPFYFYLDDMLKNDNVGDRLRKLTFLLVMISCTTYIFIGVFPGDIENVFFYWAHGTFALICYMTLCGYMLFLNWFFLKNPKFLKIHSYLGFIIAVMIFIFLFTWNPNLQWIFSIAYTIWLAYIPVNLIYKKI